MPHCHCWSWSAKDINQILMMREHHMGNTDFERDFSGGLNSGSETAWNGSTA